MCILCCSMGHCAITQRHHAACCLRPRRPLPHAATPPRPPPPTQSPFTATHVSPPPDMPHNVAASVWQCDASSNRLQVQSVTRVFSHSANGGDDYFVLCLLSSSRRLLSPSHFECSSVQRAIDAAWIALCSSYDTHSRCQSGGT